jgi:hypothetical protein
MLMMHGIECDLEKIATTYLKGKDGRDKSSKEFIEDTRRLANHLALYLAERNAKRKATRDAKRTGRGASLSKATGSLSYLLIFQCTLSVNLLMCGLGLRANLILYVLKCLSLHLLVMSMLVYFFVCHKCFSSSFMRLPCS